MTDTRSTEAFDALSEALRRYAPDADLGSLRRAWEFANRIHEGRVRRNGDPHILHPLAVARLLADLRMDLDTLAAALLHEVMEAGCTREQLQRAFGPEVADLVEGMSRIGRLRVETREQEQAENFRRMLLAVSRDIRVMIVRLADRLHNLRTLDAVEPELQASVAQEILDIYAPLANRLGFGDFKAEMEDLSLRYLHPEVHARLVEDLEQTETQRRAYIERTQRLIQERLKEQGLRCEVTGRAKGLMSIWRKMVAQRIQFDQVYDLLAFRILVDDLASCYAALGHIHGLFQPLPHRIKDFVAMPKPNGYRSLHTTVLGPENQRIEVQIRTWDMHHVAVNGIAAHWRYKEGRLALSSADMQRMGQLREILDSAREVEDPAEFLQALRTDLFVPDVYVFTPRGEVKVFPQGATTLDFAYAVHSDVGNHCVGARVDGRIVPLRHELQSGETVEILTRPDQKPSRDWLRVARSGHTLSKIRKALREEEEKQGIEMGRQILEAELRKRGKNLNRLIRDGAMRAVLRSLDFREPERLYLAIARNHLQPAKVCRELAPDVEWGPARQEPTVESLITRHKAREASPVLIHGEQDLYVTYARCCNPLPGEPVQGFITQGHGISVHAVTCPQLLAMDAERRIAVQWDARVRTQHVGGLRIVCANRPGLLANISSSCEAAGINIHRLEVRPLEDQKAACEMEVGVYGLKDLADLMRRLEKIRGVVSVVRTRA